ncbi:MAG: hypothetical protein AB7O67_23190 [Vicinamibacterales bacterium]
MSTRLETRVIAKTAAFTIRSPHVAPGTVFTNRGATGTVTFTLPTPNAAVQGAYYEFRAVADYSIVVAAPTAGQIIAPDDAAADNVGLQISGKKVGRGIRVHCDGTSWHAFPFGAPDGFCVDGTEYPIEIGTFSLGGVAVSATAAELNYLAGVTAGTAAASKAVVLDANKDIGTIRYATMLGLLIDPIARTATADGTGTGTIADAGKLQHITVTSADANNIIVLPTPTPGTIVVLGNGGTGYELRSSDPANVAINGGTGASAESAIPANSLTVMVCTSATTWQGITLAGTTLAAVEAAA